MSKKSRRFRKIRVMLAGFRFAVLEDFNVLYKVVLSFFIFVPALWFRAWLDASLIIFATGMNISVELLNTAIEAICDFIHPDHHEKIGMIKDIAAAAVGIVSFVWLVVMIIEIIEIWPLIKQSMG